MKKLLALLLALCLCLALVACGGGDQPAGQPEEGQPEDAQPEDGQPEDGQPEDGQPEDGQPDVEMSDWLKTKTGKFYSRFEDGKMYMKYEMEYDGTTMTVISATNGDKSYSESIIDGQSNGATIIEGDTMYAVDHASKTVVKMTVQAVPQQAAGALLTEEEFDVASIVTGTREIDGKSYDTEEWILEGAKSVMCFDGDNLAYMIGELEGEESVVKVVEASDKVDESLFEIPADYQLMSY